MANGSAKSAEELKVRLDKWLWAARFYKTRALARDMIQGGKVHYNGKRTKPSKIVELGALIQLRQGQEEREVKVLQLYDKRQSAPLAQQLYQETEQSIALAQQSAKERELDIRRSPSPERRPDKKQRRQLIRFKNQ
ncbi:ribosome-associated heat shock protein Hsp15 [Dongshaea marina]|uniref:ribosome-associated heat shock protein Hsp15 n=1 Tax=Dongshaea marina TaxID=2047966 RepID=UPI000D3EE0B9|nr:ribosome-associated heat shock protein Hsp15 [Dongshaea marina]